MYEASRLEPRQLQAIFEANLPLLLEVFNPQGWCVFSPIQHVLFAPYSLTPIHSCSIPGWS